MSDTSQQYLTDKISDEDFAALFGCDPVYDQPPRQPGDGYHFYNFAVECEDPDFLKQFIPAIERTIQDPRLDALDRAALVKLRSECQRRLETNNETARTQW